VDVHDVLEHPRRYVADVGEVGHGAAELDVEVGGDVAALEVEVDQGCGPSGAVGGQGQLDGRDGGPTPPLDPATASIVPPGMTGGRAGG